MPRASDGTVTLVAGNPVVADTDIVTTWANPTISDLASMAQDSLSRTGKGGMLVPFQNLDGTVAAPGITFTNQTGTGLYRSAAGLGVTVAGALKALFAAALTTFKEAVKMEKTLEVTGRITATAGVAGILTSDLPLRPVDKLSAVISTGAVSPLALTDIADAVVSNFVSGGNRIFITFTPDGSATPSEFMVNTATSVNGHYAYVACFRSATGAGTWTRVGIVKLQIAEDAGVLGFRLVIPASSIVFTNVPGVATGWDYKFQAFVTVNTITAVCSYMKLVAFEL